MGGYTTLIVLLGWICSLHLVDSVRTHREHKVHNIVLYPDKHSWCKTTPIKQVVAWPGCVAREIDNNVCVGACFSYTIPQTEPSAPGDVISPYCDSCQPSEVTWLNLTLECNHEDEAVETLGSDLTTTPQPGAGANASFNSTVAPILMQKSVQVITNCSCSSCHGHAHHHVVPKDKHAESDHASPPQLSLLDVPELMGLMREVHTRKLAANLSSANPPPLAESIVPSVTLPVLSEAEEEERKEDGTELPAMPPVEPITSEPAVVHHHAHQPAEHHPVEHTAHHPLAEHHSAEHHSAEHQKPEDVEQQSTLQETFEHFPPAQASTAGHGHHPHGHHTHHHGHHHHPAHLEVPQEKLQPAQEGAEMSYHDNLVPSDQSQEKDEEF